MLNFLYRKRWFLIFTIAFIVISFIIGQIPLKASIEVQSFSEIKAVNPFPSEFGGIKKGMLVSGEYLFNCDIKMPAGMTGEIIGRLISLDPHGTELVQPQDIIIPGSPQRVYKFAEVFQDIPLLPASEQPAPNRYTLYRTETSIMVLDCILEEGKVPSDYNVIVHHIDPIGKVRFELVTSVPPGEPGKINPQAPATVRDIAGIRVNGSFPSFAVAGDVTPSLHIIFSDEIQPATLEVVRDDGDDTTGDEVEIPVNLFTVNGHRVQTGMNLPRFLVGINRIVATALSKTGVALELKAHVLIYPHEKEIPLDPLSDYVQEYLIPTEGEDFLIPGIAPVRKGDEYIPYTDEILQSKHMLALFFDKKLTDWSITTLLRRYCLMPSTALKQDNFVGVKKLQEIDSLTLLENVFAEPQIIGGFIPGKTETVVEGRPYVEFVAIRPESPVPVITSTTSKESSQSDPDQPFTGSGATGEYKRKGFGLFFGIKVGLDREKYENPLKKDWMVPELGGYLSGLSQDERIAQVNKLVGFKINTVFPEWYKNKRIPTRKEVIKKAAAKYELSPQLLTSVILAEQRDQSKNEDMAEFCAGINFKDLAVLGYDKIPSVGLGQIRVTTVKNHNLFSDFIRDELFEKATHGDITYFLTSEELNIFATAKYIRIVADEGAAANANFPMYDLSSLVNHSVEWGDPQGNTGSLLFFYFITKSPIICQLFGLDPNDYQLIGNKFRNDALILMVVSEYNSKPWDGEFKFTAFWGWFAVHAWIDAIVSGVFE